MLMTTAMSNQVTELAVVMFGAAPGGYKSYLDEVYVNNGGNVAATAAAYGQEPVFALLHADAPATMIANLSINSITDSATKTMAMDWINTNVTTANAADLYAVALDYMKNNTDGFDFSEALAVIDAKVAVANSFTKGYGANVLSLDILQQAIADVDADTDVNAEVFESLTTGADVIFGDGSDNLFMAGLSADADTLQSGDYINGGAGTDTLEVTLANTPYAITPETTAVEILKVRSQADGYDEGDNDVQDDHTENTIDAQNMRGVEQFWSTDSRASLVVEDVRRDSHTTTIGWQNADAGDVDYSVYFDDTNITAPNEEATGSQLFLELLDLENGTDAPLQENPYVGVIIKIGDTDVTIAGQDPITTTYADLVDALNASLAAQGYDTVTASLGANFTKKDADGVNQTGQTIVLTNSGTETLSAVGWTTGGAVLPPDTNVHTAISNTAPSSDPYLTQTDIILDWVGRGSKSGDFLAGNMSNDSSGSGSAGIQQFNVEVDRDSWLNSMSSTNNALEVINVDNIGDNGSLRIDAIEDVRVFDASGMTGNVTLAATLSEDVVDKYLDLQDDATNPAEDNSEIAYSDVVDTEFSYDMGAGNDTLSLEINSSNLAEAGTANREDFVLEVNGNAGNDTITLSVVEAADDLAENADSNWDANHAINANITVNGGEGNDTIMTPGAGDFTITAGAGDDTVYTDNAGAEKAVWVLNSTNVDVDDLASEAADSVTGVNAYVTVTYKGISVEAEIADSYGALTAQTITDLQVNQAIKDAINNDATLSKLLDANDGPGRSLVISSEIDGVNVLNDLTFTFSNTALTTAQTNAGLLAADLFDSADFADGDYDVALGAATPVEFGQVGVVDVDGVNSTFASDNTITGGAGDDIIVLSTGGDDTGADTNNLTSTATDITSNEVVVYDAAFGNDVIVNFTGDLDVTDGEFSIGSDVLDFTAFLTDGVATTLNGGVNADSNITVAALLSNGDAVLDAGENDNAAAVKALLTDDATANKGVYVAVDADNIGTVYSIVDGTGATDLTVTLLGTIDLADTNWTLLTVDNFA